MTDHWEARLLAQGIPAEAIAAARANGLNMAKVADDLAMAAQVSWDPVQFFLELQELARAQRE